MSTTTPMSKLSNHFKTLEGFLPSDVSYVSLNKAGSHYKHHVGYWDHDESEYTKGVHSDYIRIYKSAMSFTSVAFSFSYINQEEPQITAIMKKLVRNKPVYQSSKILGYDEFRKLFNEFNAYLKEHPIKNFDQFVAFFMAQFLMGQMDAENVYDVTSCKQEYLLLKEKLDQDVQSQQVQHAIHEKKHQELITSAQNEIKQDPLYVERLKISEQIYLLQEKLRNLNMAISDKSDSIYEEKGINKENELVIKYHNEVRFFEKKRTAELKRFMGQYPFAIRKLIDENYKG